MKKSLSLALTSLAVVSVQGQFSECFGDNEQFIIPGDTLNQADAISACAGVDGTLARVGSTAELQTLQRVIGQTGNFQAWIGLEDLSQSAQPLTSDFTFVDGNVADLAFIDVGFGNLPWTSSAPSDGGGSCVLALNVGPASLVNSNCANARLYVCRNECPPTAFPTTTPTINPTQNPTNTPSVSPTRNPTGLPTQEPTNSPTALPTVSPTKIPTASPTTALPTASPTTELPTASPTTALPTTSPTKKPTKIPTTSPTTAEPTTKPSFKPTVAPTEEQVQPFILITIGGVVLACAVAACCCCAS